jgi:hypothetical protein
MLTKRFNIICGHYGCGKTNLALNLAIDCAAALRKKNTASGYEMGTRQDTKVILVDLDLVNPYFRSSDFTEGLEQQGIRVIAPVYANSNVDIPSLPAEMDLIFDTEATVILDVGGDDVGATVLGRYRSKLQEVDYDMFYVVNRYRNLTVTAEEAAEILHEIETSSRCRATAVVNNSHLKAETTLKLIKDSEAFARKTAELLKLPLRAVTLPRTMEEEYRRSNTDQTVIIYPVDILVKTIWE